MIFQKLRDNQLYVKREKCAFAQTRINFLGHIIERGQIRMDMKKVRAIQEWKTPANVKELRSFLGLANYYRRFVEEYSKTAAPLTELLKKGVTWDWGIEGCFFRRDILSRMRAASYQGLNVGTLLKRKRC
ncbi:hypothetical protein UlMin_044217 [Ulmus minor]